MLVRKTDSIARPNSALSVVRRAATTILCISLAANLADAQVPTPVLTGKQLGQWKATKLQLQTLADANDATAAYQLGLMYEFPQDGRPVDRSGSAYWYKVSADRGNVRATYRLALYFYDQGNDNLSYSYFERAAQAGLPAAMFRFGEMLVRTNFRGNGQYYGLPWLEKAANAGDADAANELGRRAWQLYLNSSPAPSRRSAAEWFARAADGGSCEGAMNLGGVYFNGIGVEQDAAKADYAFRSAERCPGAPDWVKEKAAHFRLLLAGGKLPDPSLFKPVPVASPRVDSHEDQMSLMVAGIIAVVGVAAILSTNSSSSAPSAGSESDPMDDFFAQQAKRSADFWQGRSYCDQGWHMAAGMMGVWCP